MHLSQTHAQGPSQVDSQRRIEESGDHHLQQDVPLGEEQAVEDRLQAEESEHSGGIRQTQREHHGSQARRLLAGGAEPGAITFDLCRDLVDDYVLVSEDDIKHAMRLFMESRHMMIEGAAGVAIASYLKMKEQFRGKNVVVVICGANISVEMLRSVLNTNDD